MKHIFGVLVSIIIVNFSFYAMPGGGGGESARTFTTTTSGNWSDNVWDQSGNGPQYNDKVIINHDITIDENVEVKDIIINANLYNSSYELKVKSTFTVGTGSYIESASAYTIFMDASSFSKEIVGEVQFNQLKVNVPTRTVVVSGSVFIKDLLYLTSGTLDVSGGSITFLNDGTNYGRIAELSGGELIGQFEWQLFVDRCEGWSNYAVPADATLEEIAEASDGKMIYTGFPGSDYPNFNFVNTYFYDEVEAYVTPSSVTDTVKRGQGFWYFNEHDGSIDAIDQQWQISLNSTLDFSQDFDFELSYGGTNWNFLGNPYPASLDWTKMSRDNVYNALYIFNTCTQTYSNYVGGISANGGSKFIAPGQSFIVEAGGDNPILTLPKSAVSSDFIDLKRSDDTPKAIFFKLNDDEIAVSTNSAATLEFDGDFDARKQITDNSTIFSMINDQKFSINVVPEDEEIVVPLKLRGQGVLYMSGANV